MSRCILLINSGAGASQRGLDASEVSDLVREIFNEQGHDLTSVLVAPGEIERQLDRAIFSRPDIIVIGGGDGTVSTAARKLGGTGIALGILPMGTFNLAARDLGVPLEIEDAARFLSSAEVFPIDVLDVSGHACLCTTILGFYPEYSGIFEKRDHGGQWWRKTLKLLTGMRAIFMRSRPLSLKWEGSGVTGTARTRFSAFVPGRYKSTAGLIPTRTNFRSGKLTAYIGTHQTPGEALRGIIDYTMGRHEENPGVQLVEATHLTLRASRRRSCDAMLDGEILKLRFPIQLRIRSRHLQVLASAEAMDETPSDAT